MGVLNLTHRARRGIYTDNDEERVRLLGLVMSRIALRNDLPNWLPEAWHVG